MESVRESARAEEVRGGKAAPRAVFSSKGFSGAGQVNHAQRKGLTTFFFSNVPENYTEKAMWGIFQRWGRVWNVYMPRRLNRYGQRFGFVRYMDVAEPKGLEKELDNIV